MYKLLLESKLSKARSNLSNEMCICKIRCTSWWPNNDVIIRIRSPSRVI